MLQRTHIQRVAQATFLLLLAYILMLAVRQNGHSPFLSDQLDQILNFERLLHFDIGGFYGPVASGTNVKSIGPIGNMFFGIPYHLGLTPDQTQIVFNVAILIGLGFLLNEMIKLDIVFAFSFAALIALVPAFWWTFWLLWINVLILAAAFLFFAGCLGTIRRGGAQWPLFGLAMFATALNFHLATLVALPIAVILTGEFFKRRNEFRLNSVFSWVIIVILAIAVLPYFCAEIISGIANTRAAFSHLTQVSGNATHLPGFYAGLESIHKHTDPFEIFGPYDFKSNPQVKWPVLLLFAAFIGLGIKGTHIVLLKAKRGESIEWQTYLWCFYVVGTLTEFFYFLLTNRWLAGYHYTLFLTPLAVMPYALIVTHLLRPLTFSAKGLLLVLFLVGCFYRGTLLSSAVVEKVNWTFGSILSGLEDICREFPKVSTQEKFPFVTYGPESDPGVLQFVIKSYPTGCQWDQDARIVLVPAASGSQIEKGGIIFVQKKVTPPGISVYESTR